MAGINTEPSVPRAHGEGRKARLGTWGKSLQVISLKFHNRKLPGHRWLSLSIGHFAIAQPWGKQVDQLCLGSQGQEDGSAVRIGGAEARSPGRRRGRLRSTGMGTWVRLLEGVQLEQRSPTLAPGTGAPRRI